MAIETPARVAVLGAGPLGLEAALYARFLGYDVDIYERGGVADNVRRWGHVKLFSPFVMNASPLGLAALEAQDSGFSAPEPEAILSGRELVERYLEPLAHSDLLVDSLHLQSEVIAISRGTLLKADCLGHEDREDPEFRILVRDAGGREYYAAADVVIDATGTYGHPHWVGAGGIPALGESQVRETIEYGLPDVLGADREKYQSRHTLLIGDGYSAATTVVALSQLAMEAPGTRVTWITRREDRQPPMQEIAGDPLAERVRLTQRANELAAGAMPCVEHRPGTLLEEIHWNAELNRFCVRLIGQHAGELELDRVVANVGYRPDNRLWRELQVHECYASGGPMKLAAALLDESSADCLQQRSCGPSSLVNPEPDFYVIGAKSYGRNSRFLISIGLGQIRDLFTILADRAELDLYANMAKLRS